MISPSRSYLSVLLAAIALILASSASAYSQEAEKATPKVTIKNFGQMDERFFRGAQPKEDEADNAQRNHDDSQQKRQACGAIQHPGQ